MDYKDGQFSVKTDKTFDRERYLDATQRLVYSYTPGL